MTTAVTSGPSRRHARTWSAASRRLAASSVGHMPKACGLPASWPRSAFARPSTIVTTAVTTRLRRVKPDAVGETIVEADELQARVRELGARSAGDYAGRELFLIGVLKGAVFFVADLMRQLDVPCELDFMAVSSYGSLTTHRGVVRILKDLDAPIEGKDVLIVEDIVDSGLTLNYLLRNLRGARPALARGLRAAGQAGAAQDRAADPLRRVRDPESLRGRLRARSRPALPEPAVRRRGPGRPGRARGRMPRRAVTASPPPALKAGARRPIQNN